MIIRNTLVLILISCLSLKAQVRVNLNGLNKKNGAKVDVSNALLSVSWPVNGSERGKIVIDLKKDRPLFKSMQLSKSGAFKEIITDADPSFLLTIGKRTLNSNSGGLYRERINLNDTRAFGKKKFTFNANLKNRKWVRLEVWDIAANGAFTQQVWLE